MRKKVRLEGVIKNKHLIVVGLMLFFLIIFAPNRVSAQETYKIEHPYGVSAFIDVNENFSIDISIHIKTFALF